MTTFAMYAMYLQCSFLQKALLPELGDAVRNNMEICQGSLAVDSQGWNILSPHSGESQRHPLDQGHAVGRFEHKDLNTQMQRCQSP